MKIRRTEILEDVEFDPRQSKKWKEIKAKIDAKLRDARKQLEIKKEPRIIGGFIVRSDYKSSVIHRKELFVVPEPNWTNEEALNNFYKINRGLEPHNVKLMRFNRYIANSFWVVPMYGGFFMTIPINREENKHHLKLWYVSDKKNWCVATANVEFNFFLKPRMTAAVKRLITLKKFYLSSLSKDNLLPK